MNQADFEVLYNKVAARDTGWEQAIAAAWNCLSADQQEQIDAIP